MSLSPSVVWAHHPVSDAGVAWMDPLAVVESELATGRFEFVGRDQGQWWTMTTRAEVPVVGGLGVGVSVPMAFVRFDDGRGAAGLSDVEVTAKYLVLATPHAGFMATLGAGLGLPTGSERDALGTGHVEAMMFAQVASQLTTRLNLLATLGYAHALSDGVMASEALAPHNPREFQLQQAVQWFWTSTLWTEAASREVVSWQDSWGDLWELGWRLGWRHDAWRVTAGVWLPMMGEERTTWRSMFNTAYVF